MSDLSEKSFDEIGGEVAAGATPETGIDLRWLAGRALPKSGVCIRCGQDRPVNRPRFCYSCWVITTIEFREPGWQPGQPHPGWCGCSLPGKHVRRGQERLGN